MNLKTTVKPGATTPFGSTGAVNLTAAFVEQLRPSSLVSVDIPTLSSTGMSWPGGLAEIVTPSTLYVKLSFPTQEAHSTKPWLAIPLSSLSQISGIDLNLSQIFGQATSSGPLSESQLLQGATSVRQVGTGSVDGVPVTEYTGTISLDKAMTYLSGSARTALQQAITAAGFSTASFTVWIDGQHIARKLVVTEAGTSVTETVTTTITSINEPVHITLPAASQTTTLSGSDLGNLG
jgi:hypothetical protein